MLRQISRHPAFALLPALSCGPAGNTTTSFGAGPGTTAASTGTADSTGSTGSTGTADGTVWWGLRKLSSRSVGRCGPGLGLAGG